MSEITNLTLDFLRELKQNNNRDWFEKNKARYQKSHLEVAAFAEKLIELMNKFDQIETPSGKKSLFRIYRDVRFSKNKEPYKINRSGSFRRAGHERRGGFYFSIEPGNTVIGGGFYQPNADDLNLIRKQIELDASPIREVLKQKKFKSYYNTLLGEQLKTSPRGFEKDDPNIDLLRFKNFYVMHSFSDDEVLSKDFAQRVTEGYQTLLPFFDAMSLYLTTDLNGVSTLS
jgi:uncharacterized protein (TIGR02453 family)